MDSLRGGRPNARRGPKAVGSVGAGG
jgi:hypothetical protein